MRIPRSLVPLVIAVSASAPATAAVFSARGAWEPAAPVPGGTAIAVVSVTIEDRWHVNSATPLDDYLIPTTVRLELPDGWKADPPVYPPHRLVKLAFSETPVAVYEGTFEVRIAVHAPTGAASMTELRAAIEAQACDDRQCLAPEEVAFVVAGSTGAGTAAGEIPAGKAPAPLVSSVGETAGGAQSGAAKEPPSGLSERFLGGSLLLQLAIVFVGGLALNLTPCVFPLIQITIGFFLAQKSGHGWMLAAVYALGMIVTYSTLGVAAAITGSLFGAALQSPWVIGILALVLLALAASMFGLWEIRVPQWATRVSGGRQGAAGAFVMGLVAGVVAAPCIGPFVLGLLTLVGQRADVAYGLVVFATLALGLSLPYVVLASSTRLIEKLPNAGAWMLGVRQLFGVLLVILAVYFVKPFLPGGSGDTVEAVARMLGGLYLLVIARPGHEQPVVDRVMRLASAAILAAGVLGWPGRGAATAHALSWLPYDETLVQDAIASGQPVILDFQAAWCLPCKELDEKTFTDPAVASRLAAFARFKVDFTKSTPANKAIGTRFAVVGVPTIAFFNRGQEVTAARLTGFEPPADFLRRLALVEGR